LAILFICFTFGLNAQSSQATIPYNLKVTFTGQLTTIGGNLVVTPENDVPQCNTGNLGTQVIYSGKQLTTAAINIDNRSSSGCVTVVIKSNGTTVRQTIPAGSVSGVLSFSRVSNITLIIDHRSTTTFPETVIATGNVDLWF
jgi:hypothetical protein